jgi:uncharacterized protein (DUF983 family)
MDNRGRMLARALTRRCPLCGARPIFDGWFELKPRCPGCNYAFEREEGYWVGALIANIAVAEAVFAVVFLTGVFVTSPDVPWNQLMVIGVALMVGLPILFYPLSKTVWMWADISFLHPIGDDDLRVND